MRFAQILGLVAVVAVASFAADSTAGDADRVARLVRQLGDNSFSRRESASRELTAIGEQARTALTRAANDPDAEVARRARQLLDGLDARARDRELARWAGSWRTKDGVWMTIDGHRWSSGTPTWGPAGGTMWVVEVGPGYVAADMFVESGPPQGQTCRAIFKLDGDRLRYCGTYAPTRATEFKAVGEYYFVEFERQKK
jgi:hypothetical protein